MFLEPAHEEMFPTDAWRCFCGCASASKNRRTWNCPTGTRAPFRLVPRWILSGIL